MRNIIAKDLKIKFIETLNELDEFSYEEGNPFLIKIGTTKYFVYLKNLSPAYFKNSPDVTRVQLPYSEHFLKIFKADIPFIILGFDVDTDTIVSWNPAKVKERLNAKSNVSLYSRSSLQENVKDDEFKFGYLSNGEKIIVFKRKNLINFFDIVFDLFKENAVPKTIEDKNICTLTEITDKELLQIIKPLLLKNKVLQAVEETAKYYEKKYKNMTFRDWHNLVSGLYRKMNT
ncbi:MAG TPA: hypothetical protein DCQ31_18460 [Bacteroidales bacterium]|nr:hypothetical protein [Bacteroidales bacterium]